MNIEVVSSLFQTAGLGIFVFYLIRGLKAEINSLKQTIDTQSKTLEVMERRIVETEKIGDIYKNLISDLPQDIDNFKTIISKTKDETILELKNQHEATKKKLEEAKKIIENSEHGPDIIKLHLRVLKNLLSEPEFENLPFKREYELSKICEFGGRTLEKCVPLLIESKTLEDFLQRIGFDVIVKDDEGGNIMKSVFFSNVRDRKTPRGEPLRYATAAHSISGGWHLIANDEFYLNKIKLDELKDEFSAVKTVA